MDTMTKATDFLARRDVAFMIGMVAVMAGWRFMMEGLDLD